MTTGQERTVEVPDRTLRRLAEARLAEAQIARLTDQIGELIGRTADPTAPSAHLSELRGRRSALLAKHPPASVAADPARQRLDHALLSISELLFPWAILELPYMTEGIYEPPGTSDVTGDLGTAGLFAGGLAFAGTLTQDSDHPVERWWTHTWRNSAVFPPAPATGRLYYRFGVNCECNIYRDPVETGSIHSYVTIGTASDVSTSPPVDEWATWETAGWPIIQTLPISDVILDVTGGIGVNGSIPVAVGNSAAIAFLYGVVISIAGGLLQLLWGNFGTGIIGGTDYHAYDKIEYRFEPDWWIKAVSDRLAGAASADG
jgi:hypothetical protein